MFSVRLQQGDASMTLKKFLPPYLMYMTTFHLLYWASIIGLHNLTIDLELARAVLGDGLVYMLIIFLPIANSGIRSLKILLFSMPVILVCVGLKYAIGASVLGYEHYNYNFENMKMLSEAVVSILIHVVLAAFAFWVTNRNEPRLRFFRQYKGEEVVRT
ncbi:hypothetical protein [Vibrio sp. 10N.239.312.D08]|uniref:hypothetical protein n=1 Tax=Vibrio sp. 10N.239.312.D08 TaxID=3229978 RepID=UPI00354DD430